MKPQSYCTLWCDHTDTHTHPAIPAILAPKLRAVAVRENVDYLSLIARMSIIVRERIRSHPDARQWLDGNGRKTRFGPSGPVVKVDALTDRTLNPRRIPKAAPFYLAWTLLTIEVLEKCRSGTLNEALRSLE